jgi:hypothetical protein
MLGVVSFSQGYTTHIFRFGRVFSSSLTEFLLWIHERIGVWTVKRRSQTYDYTIVFMTMMKSVNSAIGWSSTHAQQSMLCLVPLFISGYIPCWHLYYVRKVSSRYVWTMYFALKMRSSERKHLVRRCRKYQSFRGSNRYGEIDYRYCGFPCLEYNLMLPSDRQLPRPVLFLINPIKPPALKLKNSAFCPHSVFMCFVCIPVNKLSSFRYAVRPEYLGAFAKLRKATISFVISVRLSECNNSAPTKRIFTKFDIWVFFRKTVWIIQVSLRKDKNSRYFTEDQYTGWTQKHFLISSSYKIKT